MDHHRIASRRLGGGNPSMEHRCTSTRPLDRIVGTMYSRDNGSRPKKLYPRTLSYRGSIEDLLPGLINTSHMQTLFRSHAGLLPTFLYSSLSSPLLLSQQTQWPPTVSSAKSLQDRSQPRSSLRPSTGEKTLATFTHSPPSRRCRRASGQFSSTIPLLT